MITNLRDLALRARTVALLVAMRSGPRSVRSLADAIASPVAEARIMLRELAARVAGATGQWVLVQRYPGGEQYGLTHDGLGWLQSQGLDATADAKRQLYAANDTWVRARDAEERAQMAARMDAFVARAGS